MVLGESWCFCSGGGKSDRLKATIFATKGAAMASLSSSVSAENGVVGEVTAGSGFLIHRNLLLTTHVNLPSATVAESSEVRLQNGVVATLVPHRFFITSSVLDLTIVGLDTMEGDMNSPGNHLKTCSNPTLDLGSVVYVLGYTGNKDLTTGEGKVAIATDNLIKLSTDGATWSPGSAGFDTHGNLAFMICDPMKLATAPYIKSSASTKSSSSSPSWKRDREMQFGIPMPIICGWLNKHWEGGVDEHNKPKLPFMRLVSPSQRWSEHHGAPSVITNEVFKACEAEDLSGSSSPNVITVPQDPSGFGAHGEEDKAVATEPCPSTRAQEIPTPEICESLKATATQQQQPPSISRSEQGLGGQDVRTHSPTKATTIPIRKKEASEIPLLDIESIDYDPRVPEASIPPQSSMDQLPGSDENCVEDNFSTLEGPVNAEEQAVDRGQEKAELSSSGSANGIQNEVREGKAEMESTYSAETAESSNNVSPREESSQQLGRRGQGGMSYNRWAVHRYPVARKSSVEKHSSFTQPRKSFSQGATSHKSNDYCTPTVSSVMKKRNANLEKKPKPKPANKTRQTAVSSSPRWIL